MSGVHYSAAYQDALWRAFVAQDKDLRRLEARKRKTAHRRTVEEHYRRSRAQLARRRRTRTCRAIGTAALALFTILFLAVALCL